MAKETPETQPLSTRAEGGCDSRWYRPDRVATQARRNVDLRVLGDCRLDAEERRTIRQTLRELAEDEREMAHARVMALAGVLALDPAPVRRETLAAMRFLLESHDAEVQRGALALAREFDVPIRAVSFPLRQLVLGAEDGAVRVDAACLLWRGQEMGEVELESCLSAALSSEAEGVVTHTLLEAQDALRRTGQGRLVAAMANLLSSSGSVPVSWGGKNIITVLRSYYVCFVGSGLRPASRRLLAESEWARQQANEDLSALMDLSLGGWASVSPHDLQRILGTHEHGLSWAALAVLLEQETAGKGPSWLHAHMLRAAAFWGRDVRFMAWLRHVDTKQVEDLSTVPGVGSVRELMKLWWGCELSDGRVSQVFSTR